MRVPAAVDLSRRAARLRRFLANNGRSGNFRRSSSASREAATRGSSSNKRPCTGRRWLRLSRHLRGTVGTLERRSCCPPAAPPSALEASRRRCPRRRAARRVRRARPRSSTRCSRRSPARRSTPASYAGHARCAPRPRRRRRVRVDADLLRLGSTAPQPMALAALAGALRAEQLTLSCSATSSPRLAAGAPSLVRRAVGAALPAGAVLYFWRSEGGDSGAAGAADRSLHALLLAQSLPPPLAATFRTATRSSPSAPSATRRRQLRRRRRRRRRRGGGLPARSKAACARPAGVRCYDAIAALPAEGAVLLLYLLLGNADAATALALPTRTRCCALVRASTSRGRSNRTRCTCSSSSLCLRDGTHRAVGPNFGAIRAQLAQLFRGPPSSTGNFFQRRRRAHQVGAVVSRAHPAADLARLLLIIDLTQTVLANLGSAQDAYIHEHLAALANVPSVRHIHPRRPLPHLARRCPLAAAPAARGRRGRRRRHPRHRARPRVRRARRRRRRGRRGADPRRPAHRAGVICLTLAAALPHNDHLCPRCSSARVFAPLRADAAGDLVGTSTA